MKIVSLIALATGLCVSAGSSAQVSENLASLRVKEAESLTKLTAEGRLLYADDYRKWGDICREAWQLAEDGHFREAIRMASKALFIGESQGNSSAQAYARRDLSLAYSYAGQLDRALEYAQQASNIAQQSLAWREQDAILKVTQKVAGDVFLRRGQASEAIQAYQSALKYSTGGWKLFVQISLANAHIAAKDFSSARIIFSEIGSTDRHAMRQRIQRARGSLALAEGNPDEALKLFSGSLSAASGDDSDYERVWAFDGIGRAQLALGNKAAALKAYLEAADTAERVRVRFRNEEFKSGLFGDMRQVFDQATMLLAEHGDADRAWELSERGRGRALLDMVRNRVTQGTGAAAFVASHAQTTSAHELMAAIPDETAVVQFHVLADRIYAWVMRKESNALVKIEITRSVLVQDIERFRAAILERKAAAMEIGSQLYRTLITPLKLKHGEALVIIPHDALHYLPFHALTTDNTFLIEHFAVSYAPSAGTLKALLSRPQMSTAPTLLAVGNPELGNAALDLPSAQREVERLKRMFPSAAVFVRKDATKSRVVEGAPKSRILHIAAHAEVDSVDPLFSRIRLAPGARGGSDLEAREVYALDLSQNSMVVLSACDSGLGRVSSGDEIWGFTRAFLGAGTSSLLVSLWPVDDESTEQLMVRFYEDALKTNDRRGSLRHAQIELLKDPKTHEPFFWAPFTLVGSWR